MTDSSGAGTGEGAGSDQGAAHLESGSQGGGSGAPGDAEVIKKSQLVAALNDQARRHDAAMAELRAELQAAKAPAAVKPPTRAELNSLVASGDLTQTQADQIWEEQIVGRAKSEGAQEAARTSAVMERRRKVDEQLSGYREVVAKAWEAGSPERAKVEREYQTLVNDLGFPPTQETEAAALRAAFGDLALLRASKSARSGPAETHLETGGGGKPDAGGGSDDGPPRGLDARKKDHYERLIRQGVYENWAAVKAELKHAVKRS